MSRTMKPITLGFFRLLHQKADGDVIALRRLHERHSHEVRTIAQWELLLIGARP